MTEQTTTANVCSDELSLFFMGNSYTSSNKLSELTKQILKAAGFEAHVQSHHPPGETFGGHLRNMKGEGPKKQNHGLYRFLNGDNQKQSWDWVLLQNQSQVPGFIQDSPGSYKASVSEVQALTSTIREQYPACQFLFIMTWGRRDSDRHNPAIFPDFITMQTKLTAGYLHYVEATSTTPDRPSFVAPVGLVFQTIYQDVELEGGGGKPNQQGTLFHSLYVKDGSHPSLAGSYVCAITIVATLVEIDANELHWAPPDLDPSVAGKLRDAVSRTIQKTVADGTIRYPWQP